MDIENKKRLRLARKRWEGRLQEVLAQYPERLECKFDPERPVRILYDPLDTADDDYLEKLGYPGEYPYTRGIRHNMYRSRLWTMRQCAGFCSAEATNRRFRYLLDQGQTGLGIAFDLPTQIGYDSDHPLARGEVGKVGVAVDSLQDMELLFDGIPLDRVSTSMTINAPAVIILGMYAAVAEKQGLALDKINGTVQNDILNEYVARGTYIFPPRESMRLMVDILDYAGCKMTNLNTISISGYHIREAGSTAAQEVAFAFSNAIAYVEEAVKGGLNVDDFAPRISFFFNAHQNFFEEVAKFRAARRIWARIMKERLGARNPRSMMLRFHTQTAGCTLTAQQPDVNIIRVACQALSAVLGGTQSLHTNCRDEALALPTEHSVTLALRTQQVIGYETGVTDTVDPLGGSYYMEALTDSIEKEALGQMKIIDDMGGAVASIEKGYMQKEILKSAYRYQKSIETGKRAVIGVNYFAGSNTEEPIGLLKMDPAAGQKQVEKIEALRKSRDQARVAEALQQLRKGAQSDCNLVPFIIEAVKSYATLGEICGVLRSVFGEYRNQEVF